MSSLVAIPTASAVVATPSPAGAHAQATSSSDVFDQLVASASPVRSSDDALPTSARVAPTPSSSATSANPAAGTPTPLGSSHTTSLVDPDATAPLSASQSTGAAVELTSLTSDVGDAKGSNRNDARPSRASSPSDHDASKSPPPSTDDDLVADPSASPSAGSPTGPAPAAEANGRQRALAEGVRSRVGVDSAVSAHESEGTAERSVHTKSGARERSGSSSIPGEDAATTAIASSNSPSQRVIASTEPVESHQSSRVDAADAHIRSSNGAHRAAIEPTNGESPASAGAASRPTRQDASTVSIVSTSGAPSLFAHGRPDKGETAPRANTLVPHIPTYRDLTSVATQPPTVAPTHTAPTATSARSGSDPALQTFDLRPASTPPLGVAAHRASKDLPGVASQLVQTIVPLRQAPNGTQTVTITLHPAELGTVRVGLSVADGHTTVRIAADSAEGASAIRSALPELESKLTEDGAGATLVLDSPTSNSAGADGGSSSFDGSTPFLSSSASRRSASEDGPSPTAPAATIDTRSAHLIDVRI